MKNVFWKIVGASIITSIVVNGVVNTTSRIRRNKLEDENYQEEIKKKKEERLAKKEARAAKQDLKKYAKELKASEEV